ncbi:MAG: homoserine dehydrogenase [Nitrososphaerales archaeon]|nr:homoserine dehydrogenase [Nitrososphaerales archaeon]
MKVILVGFGTIGSGLAAVFEKRARTPGGHSPDFKIVAVVDSKSAAADDRGLTATSLLRRKRRDGRVGSLDRSALEVIRDSDADAIVEATPASRDGEPALSHIREALRSSKSVVTANKMPLALHYSALLGEARRRGVGLLYGACVGGGLPILEFGRACAEAETVDRIDGVLNATSNFVLTKIEEGESYAGALREAQKLGYAETDPSFDIDGLDAACKLVILANHVMGRDFRLKDVKPLSGIRRVTHASVRSAGKNGRAVRLVAHARKSLDVIATEVVKTSPLAVKGPSHAVVFHCSESGDRAILGRGAGSVTTSLAVLRDLIQLARVRAA